MSYDFERPLLDILIVYNTKNIGKRAINLYGKNKK